ncbi:heavy-metal-associated domain-containing protein [Lederbergia lenta]|uniref:Heavy metal transport/detoxification protein n=1 Tax=Lederbergia lenta TaxID=1467 RepID=A0A2X4VNQ2_LEDLE|nr:cation transporter [Lederbergia lenta]MEC2323605.1 cation transporter [Lederbergia lenta]SQI52511.1 Heavy metal transport/detoxification protein [Lederbergia lenta]
MTTVRFQLETLSCPTCIKKIEGALNRQQGVKAAKVLFHSSKVKTNIDESIISVEQLEKIITKLGYSVLSIKVS